ncbi:MAG TPA: glycosyl hydrolase family 32 [Micromonosporaceae bacterium]|nr:glycosyl hydrolase family 32 [Micromonosporaceae bacterium]
MYHLFFLRASRALGDPDRRHMRASVGHAVSTDLRQWVQVADALVVADRPAFDDIATWTGSAVRAPGGSWHMFYTGASSAEHGLVQRIGLATSDDLMTWHRHPGPVVEADPRWYELLGDSTWPDQAWRDPWVFADPSGNGWRMLVTARANHGPVDDRGVIGYAHSTDLLHWTVGPPLTPPGAGFGHLEVPQVEVVNGQPLLIFSCLPRELANRRTDVHSGVWAVTTSSLLGPFDPTAARPVTDQALYSGRIIRDPDGQWVMLAFHNYDANGQFIGELSDPMPITVTAEGAVELERSPQTISN